MGEGASAGGTALYGPKTTFEPAPWSQRELHSPSVDWRPADLCTPTSPQVNERVLNRLHQVQRITRRLQQERR